MKKLLLVAAVILSITSVCFAQSAPAAKPMAMAGVVKSVAPTQIVIADAKGAATTFAVSPKTVVVDKDEKPSMLTKITAGEGIIVQYRTVGGVNAAIAIKTKG